MSPIFNLPRGDHNIRRGTDGVFPQWGATVMYGTNTLYRFMRPYTVRLCGCFMRVLYAMAYTTLCYMFLEKALCQALCVMD